MNTLLLMLAIFWGAVVSLFIVVKIVKDNNVRDAKGTYHCPYCGSTVGTFDGKKEVLDIFFVEEGDEEESLPDNVISIRPRPELIFVDDDED